jgi:DNA-binding transcriptional regulator GbsR (MarR family)
MHLSTEERLLFTLITRSPMKKTDLRRETKMDSRQLDKILKELESRRLIKSSKESGKRVNTWIRYDAEDVVTEKIDSSIAEVLKDVEGDI